MELVEKTPMEKWIEALESGEYKQGKEKLQKARDLYCCLGVACDVFHKETGEGRWFKTAYGSIQFAVGGIYNEGTLPPDVYTWLGMRQVGLDQGQLARLNDHGSTFAEIVTVIRTAMQGESK
jgi:hypothetical protein